MTDTIEKTSPKDVEKKEKTSPKDVDGEVLNTYYCPKTGVSYDCDDEVAKSLVTEVIMKNGTWWVKEPNKYVTKEWFENLMKSNPYLKFHKDTLVFAVDPETGDVNLSK